ncbi:MAG TPA: type II toxin-antitoxin system VapC family toxin [Abditibacteriaceae bacterium]|jgi:PIN domain nuclease of toxin-antitoxin system
MKLLLDTHSFIWFINGDPSMSLMAQELIEDLENQRFLSVASVWEIAIKMSIGKLQLNQDINGLVTQLQQNSIVLLPIATPHLAVIATMPQHHRDPFDRLIIAQAQVEQMSIVGADTAFDAYGITRLW